MGNCLSCSPSNYNSTDENERPSSPLGDGDADLTEFSFKQLKIATRNFKRTNYVGGCRFGDVFRGQLRLILGRPKTVVAIKRHNLSDVFDLQELQSEIQLLGRLRHPNLVKFLGSCSTDSYIFVVYEFARRGSLEANLFGPASIVRPLSWETRIKIAAQAARAFAFLAESDGRVVSRYIKPSNILLDEAYDARIDFCLEKLSRRYLRHAIVGVPIAHFAYIAPEVEVVGNVHPKSDVYSFGVVLMELLTGLRAIDKNISPETLNVREWEKLIWSSERNLRSIMDPKMGNYPIRGAIDIRKLAFRCLAQGPASRPSMEEVLQQIQATL